MTLQARGIVKRFGSFLALDRVDLEVRPNELLALLGPSGSGKTTLLRILGGLEPPDAGTLEFFGNPALNLKPAERGVGFVFQHYSLFRHMTVFDNVAFGLQVKPRRLRPSAAEIERRVEELLALVQLSPFAGRYPSQLSGGQRQRVALARALAIEPKVLLLDEPFGALDAKVRKELRRWLRRLHDEIHVTSVFVTHDQEEALELADRLVVMNQGRIEQIGTPTEVYDRPATPFVYDFLGNVNRFEVTVQGGHARLAGEATLPLDQAGVPDGPALAFVRPHDIELAPPNGSDSAHARIRLIHAVGPAVRIDLEVAGQPIEVLIDRERLLTLGVNNGDWVSLRLRHSRLFARSSTDEVLSGGAGI